MKALPQIVFLLVVVSTLSACARQVKEEPDWHWEALEGCVPSPSPYKYADDARAANKLVKEPVEKADGEVWLAVRIGLLSSLVIMFPSKESCERSRLWS